MQIHWRHVRLAALIPYAWLRFDMQDELIWFDPQGLSLTFGGSKCWDPCCWPPRCYQETQPPHCGGSWQTRSLGCMGRGWRWSMADDFWEPVSTLATACKWQLRQLHCRQPETCFLITFFDPFLFCDFLNKTTASPAQSAEVDEDGSGTIDFDEFQRWYAELMGIDSRSHQDIATY